MGFNTNGLARGGIKTINDRIDVPAEEQGVKRYNLVLPMQIFNRLKAVAEEKDDSVVTVLKQFIKLGLLVVELEKNPDAELIIREGDQETLLKTIL